MGADPQAARTDAPGPATRRSAPADVSGDDSHPCSPTFWGPARPAEGHGPLRPAVPPDRAGRPNRGIRRGSRGGRRPRPGVRRPGRDPGSLGRPPSARSTHPRRVLGRTASPRVHSTANGQRHPPSSRPSPMAGPHRQRSRRGARNAHVVWPHTHHSRAGARPSVAQPPNRVADATGRATRPG